MNSSDEGATVRSEKEALRNATLAELWIKKIDRQKTDKRWEKWRRDAQRALAAYEAGEINGRAVDGANLFHANVQTLVPAVFNSAPVPDLRVRFDEDDAAAKSACDVLERVAISDIDNSTISKTLESAARKAGIVGVAVPRVRYQVVSWEIGEFGEQVIALDEVYVEMVPWDRYIEGPARTWKAVPWIAFEHDMTMEALEAIVGPNAREKLDEMPWERDCAYCKHRKDQASAEPTGIFETIKVYEVWDRASKKVLYCSPDLKQPIHTIDDPLRLRQFYPVPEPLTAGECIDGRVPLVHYAIHARLFERYETSAARIHALTQQIKVCGLYDKKQAPDFERLRDALDGDYLPAETTDEFIAGGGKKDLSGAVLHWPIEMLVAVARELQGQNVELKQEIWEATGIADIMRGHGNAQATATHDQLKSQYGQLRIKNLQEGVAELARACLRLMIEVRAQLTPWPVLKKIAMMKFEPTKEQQEEALRMVGSSMMQLGPDGQPQPPDPQMQAQVQMMAQQQAITMAAEFEQQVQAVIKSPWMALSIDIETDSTIRGDVTRDMEQFNGLIGATSQFAMAVSQLAPIKPDAIESLGKVYAAQVRKFRLGREGEQALDELIEAFKGPVQSQGPSPEQQQAMQQQEMAAQQAEQVRASEKEQREAQRQEQDQQRQAALAQREAADDERRAQHEREMSDMKRTHALELHGAKMQQQQAKLLADERMAELKAEMQMISAAARQAAKPAPTSNGAANPS